MVFLDNGDLRNKVICEYLKIPLVTSINAQVSTVILPITSCNEEGMVGDISLVELYNKYGLKKIIAGKLNGFLNDFKNVEVISYYNEDLVNENSRLTAEGLLAYMINNLEFSLIDKRILLIGYGHAGIEIAKSLEYFTSDIDVYNRTFKTMKYNYINKIEDFDYDIIINTVPVKLFDINNKKIFDISSKNVYGGFFIPKIPSGKIDGGILIANKVKELIE